MFGDDYIYFTGNSSVKSRYIQMRAVEHLYAMLEKIIIFFYRCRLGTKSKYKYGQNRK